MSFSPDEQKAFDDISPIVNSLGFSVVDLKMKTINGTLQIHLVVYADRGVSIEDCSNISKTIYPRLEMNLDREDFSLEVSSPGIGRVLKDKREYGIFQGVPIALLFDGESEWKNGEITLYRDDEFLDFFHENNTERIKLDRIRKAKLI